MTNLSTLPGFGASSGGGGGSSTAEPVLATYHAGLELTCGADTRNANAAYSGVMAGQAPSGIIKNRETFAYWAQWQDSYNNYTGFTISSFKVDKSTGQPTQLQAGPQDVWTNSSGSATSTTYLIYDPIHGCFFSGGHNAYPGYSSHMFGYTKGQVKSDGSIGGGGASYTNQDHGYNGTFCGALPQGTGTNYFLSGGYSSSYAGRRVHQADATGISVGSFSNNGSWTSSSNAFHHIYQPDVNDTGSGEVTSVHGTSFTQPNYGWDILRDNNASTIQPIETGYQRGTIYCGYGGVTVLQKSNSHFGTLGNGSNNFQSLKDSDRDLGSHTQPDSYACNVVGIGNNKFLYFNVPNEYGRKVDLVDFDSSNNPRHIKRFTFGGAGESSVLDGSGGYLTYFVVFENNSDNYPKWLVQASHSSGNKCSVKVYEITADLSTYNYTAP